jgi:hypothetical protein
MKKPDNQMIIRFFAVWTGLEPATPCVTGRYSNQLNYQTVALSGCKYKSVFYICKAFYMFFKNIFFY